MYFKMIPAFFCMQIFLLGGCISFSKTDRVDDVIYVIPHHQPETSTRRYTMDLSMLFFYGNYNFILTDNRLFLHKKYKKFDKNEKIDYSIPPKLNLKSTDLTEIELANLPQLLNSTIIDSFKMKISIVSNSDTIRNQAFNVLSNFFQSKSNITYIIRNWTDEEQLALKALILSNVKKENQVR